MTTVFVASPRGLQQLHPLTNLALVGLMLVAAATLPQAELLLGAFVLVLLPLAAWSRVLWPFLRACLRLIWPFAVSLTLIQGVFAPGRTVLLDVGLIHFKLEGLVLAGYFTARLLLGLGAATLFSYTTRPDLLMVAFTQRGLPPQLAYIIVTSLQIIPSFQTKARSILDAQRSRGLETEGRLSRRLRALVPLIGPLLLGSLVQLEGRAIALEARGFGHRGPRTSLHRLRDSPAQALLRWLSVFAMAALILVRVMPPWR